MPAKPESRRKALFVHSFLDDLGLTPTEFRVYAHLTRRADWNNEAYPGIRGIAKACRIDKDTVTRTIASLEKRGMLVIGKAARNGNLYLLTEPSDWVANTDSEFPDRPNPLPSLSPNTLGVSPQPVHKVIPFGNPREEGELQYEDHYFTEENQEETPAHHQQPVFNEEEGNPPAPFRASA